jgi:hypothetical protein
VDDGVYIHPKYVRSERCEIDGMKVNFKRGWRRLTIVLCSAAALCCLLLAWIDWSTIQTQRDAAAAWQEFQAFLAQPDRFIKKSDLTSDIVTKYGRINPDPNENLTIDEGMNDEAGNDLRSSSKNIDLSWANDRELGEIVRRKYPQYYLWLRPSSRPEEPPAHGPSWWDYALLLLGPPLCFVIVFGVMRLIEWLVSGFAKS